ncbi:hypothetical protein [Phenylobacterium sp.]|uniref:hypothetical protein n=1 Tax=Phenylobacterium sp. TaxID=1871053 RepID=UPI002CD2236F|nr:hypothetical protein [Phenylobacterium sp.]HVI33222.1 hypothetical protein [Phenylobacterium sp.]
MPGHEIPLATFVRTASETEAVIRAFTAELLGAELQVELFVLPPEEGTFLQRLGVIALAWGAVWAFTESDVGKGFIKGLTGHEPAYWAEVAGKAAREAGEAAITAAEAHHEQQKKFEELVIVEATMSFLQKPTAELEDIGVPRTRFRNAYAAKNAFYDACEATPRLRAIGFSEAPVFPIRKEDFGRLQTDLLPKLEDVQPPWLVGTVVLHVTSPNWDRADRARAWKGRDQQGRERYFRVEDEEFWQRVAAGAVSTHVIDTMKVQWAFRGRPDHPKHCRVLRVLEFNGQRLARPLSDDALAAQLGKLDEVAQDQYDLFGDWPEQST